MQSQVYGLDGHIKGLERIAAKCDVAPEVSRMPKDKFDVLKRQLYSVLNEARNDVKERCGLIEKRGHCRQSIRLGQAIRKHIDEVKLALPQLRSFHKNAATKASNFHKKTSATANTANHYVNHEEHRLRTKDVRALQLQFDHLVQLFERGNAAHAGAELDDEAAEPLFNAQSSTRSHEFHGDEMKRTMSSEEQRVVDNIRKNDEEINKQIKHFRSALKPLRSLASKIGKTADRSTVRVQALRRDIESAAAESDALVLRMQQLREEEFLLTKNHAHFCCKFCLWLIFFMLISVLVQQLKVFSGNAAISLTPHAR